MTSPLIPQPFWFRPAFRASRLDRIPQDNAKGRLLDLPESSLLPSLGKLDGSASWSKIFVAWNPRGLGISVEVIDKPGRIHREFEGGTSQDGFVVWIDTRDTRNIHRASRFCHKIKAWIVLKSDTSGLEVNVAPQKIARAQADAPLPDEESYPARAALIQRGWRLEVFIPSETLQGFDPENNRRLGFNIQVTDPDRGDEFLTGLGKEFPQGEDPSLWPTLELTE